MATLVVQATKDDDIREALLAVPGLDEGGDVDLIVAPFEATRTTDLGTLVVATFPGYATKTSGVVSLIRDGVSGKWWFYFPEPVGGWAFTRGAGAGDSETVYGLKIDGMGCALIPPCPMAAEGDTCVIGDILIPFDDLVAGAGS